jgi:hypothetical protein
VFEKRVLSRIFGSKRDEVTGDWRKLHNEELQNLYFLPNIIRTIKSRRMRRSGYAARMREKGNAYRILVGNLERKGPLGRPIGSWEDTIQMDFREIEWGVLDWIDLGLDRDQWRALVNTVMKSSTSRMLGNS